MFKKLFFVFFIQKPEHKLQRFYKDTKCFIFDIAMLQTIAT